MLKRFWEVTKESFGRLSPRHQRLYGWAAVVAVPALLWSVYSLICGQWIWVLVWVICVAGLYGLFWLDSHKEEVQKIDDLDKLP